MKLKKKEIPVLRIIYPSSISSSTSRFLQSTFSRILSNPPYLSSLFFSWYFRGMPGRRSNEGFECGTLGIDAQRHSFALLVLCYKTMDEFFALPNGVHALLVVVAERSICRRLKVPGIHPTAGHGVTALAHAGVVPQTTLVQVRVRQSVTAWDTLSRIEHKHATQKMNSFMCGPIRQHVQNRQWWLKEGGHKWKI